MDNKKITVILVVLIVLALGGAGAFFVASQNSSQTADITPTPEVMEEVIPTINPDELGLSVTPRRDGNAVILEITKLNDISAIDYELSYLADGDIPRGAIGHIDIKPTDTKIKREILFGTCSDVCHYDKGVTDVKIVFKVTKDDGKTYQLEEAIGL